MISFLTATFVFLTTSTASAQNIDRFYPPAVGAGDVATITAEGKMPTWPCQIVCDRDDIKVTCDEKSGQLKVTVPAGAAPGIAWIRFHDDKSATNLCPLIVESITVTLETDDALLTLPAVVAGRLEKGGDVDGYRVELKSGQTFVASAIAHQVLQSPMDAVLQLADLDGNVLAQSDDVRGLDPQLVYQATADLAADVRIFAFPSTPNSTVGFSGANTHVYVLRVTTGPLLDHVLPAIVGVDVDHAVGSGWNLPTDAAVKRRSATNISPAVWHLEQGLGWHLQSSVGDAINMVESANSAAHASAESLPIVFSGRITSAKQIDRLRFDVAKGKKYMARSYAKSSGFLLDPVLRVIDVKSGDEIARKDDVSRTDFDAIVEFKAKEDAELELQVSDAVEDFGLRHVYGVLLEEVIPSVRMSVAADHFTLVGGNAVEIPITIARAGGYAEDVQLSVTGLPDGVTAAAVTSQAKGDTAKAVKLKLTATENAAFQGSIQIVGMTLDKAGKPSGKQHTAIFALRNLIDVSDLWLSVSPK